MKHLLDPQTHQLDNWLAARGEPRYRAAQVRHWLFAGRIEHFAQMTDLGHDLRQALAAEYALWTTAVVRHTATDDGTEKLLLRLADGHDVECVLLRDGRRRTICISSQVGCAMGCVFCASGLDGVVRNLTSGEIVEQMLRLARLLPPHERLSHLVVMGMGEPLANLDHLLPALDEAVDAAGLGISPRRVTISTVGLPAAMQRLAQQRCRFNLAVSLHAADDDLRNSLVPVNRRIGLHDILAAADAYFAACGRRLTFEYVLLAGLNDQPQHAQRLAGRLRGRPALLNLIPYNPVAGLPYQTPSAKSVHRFVAVLVEAGINVQVRQRKGSRIDAACGQLRRAHLPAPAATTSSVPADSP